jgi:hypothetical protein
MAEKLIKVEMGQDVRHDQHNVKTGEITTDYYETGKQYEVPQYLVDSWLGATTPIKVTVIEDVATAPVEASAPAVAPAASVSPTPAPAPAPTVKNASTGAAISGSTSSSGTSSGV